MNASRFPSGLGTASRICFAMNVAESAIGYSNFTSGPNACTTFAWNGISCGALPSMGVFQRRPFHVVTMNFESGVNDMPGYVSSADDDSMSSRCAFITSQRSSPVSRLRTRTRVEST